MLWFGMSCPNVSVSLLCSYPISPTLHHAITIMNSDCKEPLLWLHTCAWTAWRLDQQNRAFSCSEVHLKKKNFFFWSFTVQEPLHNATLQTLVLI